MFYKNTSKTFFSAVVFSGFLFMNAFSFNKENNGEIIGTINSIASQVPTHTYGFSKKLEEANSRDPRYFGEEELIGFISSALALGTSYGMEKDVNFLRQAKETLIEKLKQYRVTGVCFDVDPNLAFFVETQNPDLNVTYCDGYGNKKVRKYTSKIDTIGLKIEAAIKIDIIFFTDTAFNFYDSDKVIEIGTGIDANISFFGGIGLTYASFSNAPGGLVIVSIPLFFAFPSLSIVTGGTLTPLN